MIDWSCKARICQTESSTSSVLAERYLLLMSTQIRFSTDVGMLSEHRRLRICLHSPCAWQHRERNIFPSAIEKTIVSFIRNCQLHDQSCSPLITTVKELKFPFWMKLYFGLHRCMTLELQTRSEVAKDYESALRIMLDP